MSRYMQELYACTHCGWWGSDPCSPDWAGEACHRDGCEGLMRRGSFVLVEVSDLDSGDGVAPRKEHPAPVKQRKPRM